jgi:hypothetical protein
MSHLRQAKSSANKRTTLHIIDILKITAADRRYISIYDLPLIRLPNPLLQTALLRRSSHRDSTEGGRDNCPHLYHGTGEGVPRYYSPIAQRRQPDNCSPSELQECGYLNLRTRPGSRLSCGKNGQRNTDYIP